MNIALSFVVVFLSIVFTKIFCLVAQNSRLIDRPNERSSHQIPTVRGGGLVFIGLSLLFIPILCYMTKTSLANWFALMFCMILLATVSFLDDLYGLSPKTRFIVQALIAGLVAVFMHPGALDFVLFSFSNPLVVMGFIFLMVIWAINHFNFMDGIDGICALQAIFLFLAYLILFSSQQESIYLQLCIILISSVLGFLIFNFPPASLFMGDVGSTTLGLLTFALALIAQKEYQIPIVYWFILNGLFLFDTTVTLVRRIYKKEKWSTPHKKHAYQRLKQVGFSVRLILLGQALFNVIFLVLVLLLQRKLVDVSWVLITQLLLLLLSYTYVEKKFPMFLK